MKDRDNGLSRRNFLKLGVAGALAFGATDYLNNPAEAQGFPQTYQDLFAQITRMAEQKVGGIWAFPEINKVPRAGFAPFLPATEQEVIRHAQQIEEARGRGIGWGRAVFPRVIVLASDHPQDHVRDTYDAVKSFGEQRGWGDITAWEGAWVYPMMMMGGLDYIRDNRQVPVMADGKMVYIDPIRLDSYAIAVNVINRGNPKMAVYMVPQSGEIHARLPQGATESSITMAFAPNRHYINIKAAASGDDIPAIIVRGVVTAPVTVLYCRPTDNTGNYRARAVQTRLEPLTGNVTIHMDFPAEDYKCGYSPFISVTMPVVATDHQGETEVIFVPGSDVKPGNSKYAPKHRITVDMLKKGKPVS